MNARPVFTLALALALAGVGLFSTGCEAITARRIVQAQTPGTASGAGATFIGPANSAQPSTQTAERTITFAVPQIAIPQPVVPPVDLGGALNTQRSTPSTQVPDVKTPVMTSVVERTNTTFGAHQDAAGIVKIAMTASSWTKTRWLGLLAVLLGIGGLLHAAGNDQGYPLVWIKTAVVGAVLMIVSNPWWLLLGLIPLGFYAVQKLGLMRIPQ